MEGFFERVKELRDRERCKKLPDEYFVVLITEEALPTYQPRLSIRYTNARKHTLRVL